MGEGMALGSPPAWTPERVTCGIFVGTTPTPTCSVLPAMSHDRTDR